MRKFRNERDGRGRDRDRKPERQAPRETVSDSLIYGVLPVLEALRADSRRVERVAIAEGVREHRLNDIIELCREHSIAWNKIGRDRFESALPAGVNHQGVYAVTASAAYSEVDDILEASAVPLIVVLDGVEDPRNLGAIVRTVECAGADGVIIPERRAVGLTDTVAKSSAGALAHVKVAKTTNLNRFIEDLKSRNIWVVGTCGEATASYTEWDWKQPSALILGNEGSGLHRLVAENCDTLVKIPMFGKVDSLNVSVAAGVILFEARRQRRVTSNK